ncbi:hypothetical protein [Tissierella sp.]|uniref:hypothetical protein n=1 Tax=Tissierella sp. TaxID=41274 RepID=UPI00285AC4E0|nr:hypothetical protein [Tissierella sp.]MDR7856084.1 hypothetical protein [Tissierella sp.]
MYEEYLGEGYHDKIRKMLTCNDELLPNRIIDAPLNIGGMKQLLSPALEKMNMFGNPINSKEKFNQLSQVAVYYLCGILCMAMKSRTSAPPFNIPKYKKNWDKKQKGYMEKGNKLMQGLMVR